MNTNTQTTETKDTNTEKQKRPNVIYVDPNRDMDLVIYGSGGESVELNGQHGNDLMIPPEDLCIAVQLEVSVPQLSGYDTRNAVTVEWQDVGGKQKISFFEGKYIGNQYVLTDFYHDISFNSESVRGGGENEALGIRSINIEYNSWYLPQVSIEFVDVRGMALMNPIDAFKGGNIENAINSFFSAFYTIPYPQFKLLVKGFYGNSVTYDLAAQDIRTTFDAQTGNVIISASFVGYSFAMFSDIPFDWIKSAPYNKYAQSDDYSYWREQIGNGRFTFDFPSKGVPIPTFAQLYEIIQTTIRLIDKINQEDDAAKKKKNLDNAYNELNVLLNRYNQFKKILLQHVEPFNKSEGNREIPNIGFDDTEKGIVRIFSTAISPSMIDDFFKDGNGVSSQDVKKQEIISSVERYNQLVKEENLGIPTMFTPPLTLSTSSNDNGDGFTSNTYTVRDENDEYFKEYGLKLNTPYYLYELKYLAFKKEVERIIEEEIERGRNQAAQDLLNKTYELVKNSISFVPTIGNMVKLFFAHFEMFFWNYFNVITKTKTRKCSDVGAPPEQVDSDNDEKGTAMLPSFFGIQTKENEGNIKCWPGSPKVRNYFKTPDTWKELEEVKFLKYYNESIIEYNKRIEQVEINLSQIEDANVWLPVNPFDVSNTILITGIHTDNPYKQIVIDSYGIDMLNDIIKEVGVRMFYGVGTWDENGSAYSTLAKAEAMNVFTAIRGQQALIDRLKRYLDTTLTSDEMVKIWSGTTENITGGGDKIKDRTGNTLLSPDESNQSLYTMLQYSFGNNANGFVIPFASIGLSHYNTGDRRIVGSDQKFIINEGVPLFYTHSNSHQATWGGKYKVIWNIQPYTPSIDIFINRVKGKDETGPELVKNWKIETNKFSEFFIKELKTVGDRSAYNQKYFRMTDKDKQGIDFPIYFTNLTTDKDKTKIVGNLKKSKDGKDLIDKEGKMIYTLENAAPSDVPLLDKNSGMVLDLDQSISNRDSGVSFILPYFEINGKNIFTNTDYYDLNSSSPNISQSFWGKIFNSGGNISNNSISSNYKKSVVLLWALGLNEDIIYDFLSNQFKFSCLKRLPKVVSLYLGAECWAFTNGFSFGGKSPNSKIGELKADIKFILEEYFKEWADNSASNILSNLELKENGLPFGSGVDFTAACTKVIDKGNSRDPKVPLTEDLFSVFGDGICNTYCGAHFVNGQLNILLDPSSSAANSLMQLYGADDLIISTYYQIFDEKDKPTHRSITVPSANGYASTFLTRLKDLIGSDTNENKTDPDKPNEITNNEEAIYASKYYQFKKIYDRWICWDDSKFDDWKLERFYDNNRTDPTNPAAITIIDKFYCDIANLLICNLDVIGSIMEDINQHEMSFLSIISNLFGKHKLLFVPTPNKVGISTQAQLLDVFRPYTYSAMAPMTVQPGFTAIYVGEPASQPSTGDYGKGRKFKDDSLNINGKDFPAHNAPPIPTSYGDANAGTMPVFCVSFGKQNQSYFKLASLTNTNPVVTEQTTRATEDIARMAKSDGTESKHGGQDLYDVYSANAYTVEVEMLGCAKIMPLMYFQLNNVYLFTGAYMIFKMSHNITPGRMITKFTGIKQSLNRTDLTENPFFAQTLIDDSADKQSNYKPVEPTPKEETNPPVKNERRNDNLHYYGPKPWVAQISDETTIDYAALKNQKVSRYYTLANCVEASDTNKALAGSWDKAGEDMPPGIYENLKAFMPMVDEVRDYVKSEGKYVSNGMCQEHAAKLKNAGFSTSPSDYDIHQESIWRRYSNTDLKWYQTFHGFGAASDIHLLYKRSKAAPRHPIYGYVFDFINTKLNNHITELLYEYSGTSRWVHYAWTPSSTKRTIDRNYAA